MESLTRSGVVFSWKGRHLDYDDRKVRYGRCLLDDFFIETRRMDLGYPTLSLDQSGKYVVNRSVKICHCDVFFIEPRLSSSSSNL
jgi:hypothetical protein